MTTMESAIARAAAISCRKTSPPLISDSLYQAFTPWNRSSLTRSPTNERSPCAWLTKTLGPGGTSSQSEEIDESFPIICLPLPMNLNSRAGTHLHHDEARYSARGKVGP